MEKTDYEKQELAREVAANRNGSFGVKHGRPPHLMDAAELSVQAWDAISSESIKNCFVKANIGVDYSDRNLETRVNALSGEMMSLLLAEFD